MALDDAWMIEYRRRRFRTEEEARERAQIQPGTFVTSVPGGGLRPAQNGEAVFGIMRDNGNVVTNGPVNVRMYTAQEAMLVNRNRVRRPAPASVKEQFAWLQ